MAFTYVSGDSTPQEMPGLVEVSGLRLSNGTFQPLAIPPLVQTPPLRITTQTSPFTDGATVTDPLYDAWQFDLTGWLYVDTAADVQAAVDYLFAHANNTLGWQTWSFYGYGWTAAKTLVCRVAGQVTVSGGDGKGDMMAPERAFVIPLIAANPVLA